MIIQFYTAAVSPKKGKNFEITNKNWFSGLTAGETLELAFQMTYGGNQEPEVVGAALDGVDYCSGVTEGTQATTTTTEVAPTSGQTI